MNRFLQATILLISLLLLNACQNETVTETPSVTAPSALQVVVAADDFAVGTPRIPFILYDGPQREAAAQQVELTLFDMSRETATAVWQGSAQGYNDYQIPYWVVYPEIPSAGIWGLEATITLADRSTATAQFTIQVNSESRSPAIGQPAPPSQNRTLATEPELSRLTSDPDPEAGLYQQTVADALNSDRPTVVTLATPAFCQTDICAPVVDTVQTVYGEWSNQVNFIHIEIYQDFRQLTLADEVAEWGLTSEPWTFVIGTDGRIVARLGGPISPTELRSILTSLTSTS